MDARVQDSVLAGADTKPKIARLKPRTNWIRGAVQEMAHS